LTAKLFLEVMDDPPAYTSSSGAAADNGDPGHIIAIDFGTTFTGVAHFHSDTLNTPSLRPHEIAERITLVQRWPDATGEYAEKIPTVLSYDNDGNVENWGASVRTEEKMKVRYFKLALQPEAYGGQNSAENLRDGLFNNFFWNNPTINKSPVELAADYLSKIYQYIHEEYFPSMYPSVWLRNQKFDYVITVPAIWTEKAKDLTRQAAVKAGIPDSSLVFVTEPEAAALYCATMCKTMDLNVGDQFLICDVGGGTVVRHTSIYIFDSRTSFPIRLLLRSLFGLLNALLGLAEHVGRRFWTRIISICFAKNLEIKQRQS
jgi:molecular chaperone DnaK (HSP70)